MQKRNKYESSDDDFLDSDEDYDEDYDSQTGGEPVISGELGDDSSTIDIDPDDEKNIDTNEDDKYDPINEFDEPEDTDEEIGETEEEEEKVEDEEVEIETEKYLPVAKVCHVKDLNKDFIITNEGDSPIHGNMEYKKIDDADRITDPIMTYYEMVRIIGTRAQQFNFDAEPLIEGLEGLQPPKMAYLELISKKTPFIIRRYLPGRKFEDWKVDELEIIHQIDDKFFVPDNFDPKSFELSNLKNV